MRSTRQLEDKFAQSFVVGVRCAGSLADADFPIAKQGADEAWRRNVYFIDPAGFEVEFVQYLSDLPEQRKLNS